MQTANFKFCNCKSKGEARKINLREIKSLFTVEN